MQTSQQESRSIAYSDKVPACSHVPGWQLFAESVLLSAIVCLSVFFLQWRYGFNLGDEGWLWYISKRTALGDVPLRDFFSYDPGRYYWSAFVFKLLGHDGFYEQLLANYLFAIIGLTLTYIAMARAGLSRTWRIFTVLLLGIEIGFPRHKIYEQTLSLIAFAAIAFLFRNPQRLRRWLLLGIVIGLAAFFGRNAGVFCALGAAVAFLVLLIRRQTPALLCAVGLLGAGVVIGYSPMLFMVAAVHGFASAFFQSVLMTKNWSWSLPIPFPWHVHLKGLHGLDRLGARAVSWLCVFVPLTYAFALWRAVRSRVEPNGVQWLGVAASAAGAGFLVHAFYNSDVFHIAQGTIPFVIVAVALAAELWQKRSRHWSAVVSCVLGFLVLASWAWMEPLVQHLKTKAHAPQTLAQISVDGKVFEVPAGQALIMNTVEAAYHDCGSRDGTFLAAPYYPGLYAFLNTRAPYWETFYLWPRSEQFQQAEIEALEHSRLALILLNIETAMNARRNLKLTATNPKIVEYIVSHFERSAAQLPDGFNLYYDPMQCKNVVQANH